MPRFGINLIRGTPKECQQEFAGEKSNIDFVYIDNRCFGFRGR